MNQPHHEASTPISVLESLRRWTLVALVGGVIGLGGVGIGLAIFTDDFENVMRVFSTIAVLAIGSALTLAIVILNERRLIDPLYFWIIFAGAFFFSALAVSGIWLPNARWWDRVFESVLSFLAAVVLSIPVAVALRGGAARVGWFTGLGVILLAFLWTMVDIWFNLVASYFGGWFDRLKVTGALWILAVTPAHAAIVTRLEIGGSPPALRRATIVSGIATGIAAAAFVSLDLKNQKPFIRVLIVLAIITTSLTLTVAIVSRMRAARRRRALGAALPIELTCPACRSAQTVTTGDSACSQCGCSFSIRITPRECLSCGYSLANLRGRVCPECGRGF